MNNSQSAHGEGLLDDVSALPVYDPAPLDEFISDLGEDGVGVRAGLFTAFLDDSTNRFVDLVTAHNEAKGEVLGSIAHALRHARSARPVNRIG